MLEKEKKLQGHTLDKILLYKSLRSAAFFSWLSFTTVEIEKEKKFNRTIVM